MVRIDNLLDQDRNLCEVNSLNFLAQDRNFSFFSLSSTFLLVACVASLISLFNSPIFAGAVSDSVAINFPDSGYQTGATAVDVSGTAADPAIELVRLRINGNFAGDKEEDTAAWNFSAEELADEEELEVGNNKIEAIAKSSLDPKVIIDTAYIMVRRHEVEIKSPDDGHDTGPETITVSGEAPGSEDGDTVEVIRETEVGGDTVVSKGIVSDTLWSTEVALDTGLQTVTATIYSQHQPDSPLHSDTIQIRRHDISIDTPTDGDSVSRQEISIEGRSLGSLEGDSVSLVVNGYLQDTVSIEAADYTWSGKIRLDTDITNSVVAAIHPRGMSEPAVDTAEIDVEHSFGEIDFTVPVETGEELDTDVREVDLAGEVTDAHVGDSVVISTGEDTAITKVSSGDTWTVADWPIADGENEIIATLYESDTDSYEADMAEITVNRRVIRITSPLDGQLTTADSITASGTNTAFEVDADWIVRVTGAEDNGSTTTVDGTSWSISEIDLESGDITVLEAEIVHEADDSVVASDTVSVEHLEPDISINFPEDDSETYAESVALGGTIADAPFGGPEGAEISYSVVIYRNDEEVAKITPGGRNTDWAREVALDTGGWNNLRVMIKDGVREVYVADDEINIRQLSPEISINKPTDGVSTGAAKVDVSGTAVDAREGDSVTLVRTADDADTVDTWVTSVSSNNGDSTWKIEDVGLIDAHNNKISVDLHASDTASKIVASDSITVPHQTIVIESPEDGYETGAAKIDVSGSLGANLSDPDTVVVKIFANDDVYDSGQQTDGLAGGDTWSVEELRLKAGENTIAAVVHYGDQSQYTDTQYITVRLHDLKITSPADEYTTGARRLQIAGESEGSLEGDTVKILVDGDTEDTVSVSSEEEWVGEVNIASGDNKIRAVLHKGGRVLDSDSITVVSAKIVIDTATLKARLEDGYSTTAAYVDVSGTAVAGSEVGDSVSIRVRGIDSGGEGETPPVDVQADSSWYFSNVPLPAISDTNVITVTSHEGGPEDVELTSDTFAIYRRDPKIDFSNPVTADDTYNTGATSIDLGGTVADARPGDSIAISGDMAEEADTLYTTVNDTGDGWLKPQVNFDSGVNKLVAHLYESDTYSALKDTSSITVRVHDINFEAPEDDYATGAAQIPAYGYSRGSSSGDSFVIQIFGEDDQETTVEGTIGIDGDTDWRQNNTPLFPGENELQVGVYAQTEEGFTDLLDTDVRTVYRPFVVIDEPDSIYFDSGDTAIEVGGEIYAADPADSLQLQVVSDLGLSDTGEYNTSADSPWHFSEVGIDTDLNYLEATLYDTEIGSTIFDTHLIEVRRHQVRIDDPDTDLDTLKDRFSYSGLSEGSEEGDTLTLRIEAETDEDTLVINDEETADTVWIESGEVGEDYEWDFDDKPLFMGVNNIVAVRVHTADSGSRVVHSDTVEIRQLESLIEIESPPHDHYDTSADEIDVRFTTSEAPKDNIVELRHNNDKIDSMTVKGGPGETDSGTFTNIELAQKKTNYIKIEIYSGEGELVGEHQIEVYWHNLVIEEPEAGYSTASETISVSGQSKQTPSGDTVAVTVDGGDTRYASVQSDQSWRVEEFPLPPDTGTIEANLYTEHSGKRSVDSEQTWVYRHSVWIDTPVSGFDTTATELKVQGRATERSAGETVSVFVDGDTEFENLVGVGTEYDTAWQVDVEELPASDSVSLVAKFESVDDDVVDTDQVYIWRRDPRIYFEAPLDSGTDRIAVAGGTKHTRAGDSVALMSRSLDGSDTPFYDYTSVAEGGNWEFDDVKLEHPENHLIARLYESDTASPVADTAAVKLAGPPREFTIQRPFTSQLVADTEVEVRLRADVFAGDTIVISTWRDGTRWDQTTVETADFSLNKKITEDLELNGAGAWEVQVEFPAAELEKSRRFLRDEASKSRSFTEDVADTIFCHSPACDRSVGDKFDSGTLVTISDTVIDPETRNAVDNANRNARDQHLEIVEESVIRIEFSDVHDDGYVIRLPFNPDNLVRDPEHLKAFKLDTDFDTWSREPILEETESIHDTYVEVEVEEMSVFQLLNARPAADEAGLGSMLIGPNPYRPNDGDQTTGTDEGSLDFEFNSASERFEIEIYTVTGSLVYDVTTHNDPYEWDVENNSGNDVASGTYLWRVKDLDTGDEETGKLTIIR